MEKSITLNEKTYTLDQFGFLNPSEQWDENFAEGMAERLGIYGGLTEQHWAVINHIRKNFLEEEIVPVVVLTCKAMDLKLDQMRKLFPSGYHRGACKIAGINWDFMYKTNYWLTYETSPNLRLKYNMSSIGFMEDFEKWDEAFALMIIQEWNLSEGLTEKHLKIINYLRDKYKEKKSIPVIYETCKDNDCSLSELLELFPEGYRRGACRIAGLPFLAY